MGESNTALEQKATLKILLLGYYSLSLQGEDLVARRRAGELKSKTTSSERLCARAIEWVFRRSKHRTIEGLTGNGDFWNGQEAWEVIKHKKNRPKGNIRQFNETIDDLKGIFIHLLSCAVNALAGYSHLDNGNNRDGMAKSLRGVAKLFNPEQHLADS